MGAPDDVCVYYGESRSRPQQNRFEVSRALFKAVRCIPVVPPEGGLYKDARGKTLENREVSAVYCAKRRKLILEIDGGDDCRFRSYGKSRGNARKHCRNH